MRIGNFDKTVHWAAKIVSAYISRNPIAAGGLPGLLVAVHGALQSLSGAQSKPQDEALRPAVPIRKSVTEDFIICLEDGRRFKSLKRHLRERYDMTPEQYRAKWRLPANYPMVAPGYAKTRSDMARTMGLGQQRRPRDEN